MATTEILPFAIAGGSNVVSQATYAAASSTSTGFVSGMAQSAMLNKAWRQSSFVAAGIANLLVNAGVNVPDDGNLSTLISNLSAYFNNLNVILIKTLTTSVTLTATETYKSPWFFIGTPASDVAVTIPSVSFTRSVSNKTGKKLTFGYSSGTTVSVSNNRTAIIAGDGSNVVSISGSGDGATINPDVAAINHGSTTAPNLLPGFQSIVSGTGSDVNLPTGSADDIVGTYNTLGGTVDVYPQPGGSINGGAAVGTSCPLASGGCIQFICKTPNNWIYYTNNT
jgi:hypothetical protein